MKTVIEMTREAGGFDATPKFLERFAELVRADAIAEEHDAIIDLVAVYGGTVDLKAAIRARGAMHEKA